MKRLKPGLQILSNAPTLYKEPSRQSAAVPANVSQIECAYPVQRTLAPKRSRSSKRQPDEQKVNQLVVTRDADGRNTSLNDSETQ